MTTKRQFSVKNLSKRKALTKKSAALLYFEKKNQILFQKISGVSFAHSLRKYGL